MSKNQFDMVKINHGEPKFKNGDSVICVPDFLDPSFFGSINNITPERRLKECDGDGVIRQLRSGEVPGYVHIYAIEFPYSNAFWWIPEEWLRPAFKHGDAVRVTPAYYAEDGPNDIQSITLPYRKQLAGWRCILDGNPQRSSATGNGWHLKFPQRIQPENYVQSNGFWVPERYLEAWLPEPEIITPAMEWWNAL